MFMIKQHTALREVKHIIKYNLSTMYELYSIVTYAILAVVL